MDIPGMIEMTSKVATIYPRDIIAPETPAGVGEIKPGDRVQIAIDRVGEMNWRSGARLLLEQET